MEQAVERQWVKEVVRAVLGTILFQRVLGNFKPNSMEVCGVTFPVPADPEVEALITMHVEAFARALDQSTNGSSRLVLSLYPTPKCPPLRPPPKPRAISSSLPPTVSSALGWFSTSAKNLVVGTDTEEETTKASNDEAEYGKVWEGWVVQVEMVAEGRRGGGGEERLRSQLNDFLLRSLMFVSTKTTHVPPITSASLQPFGVQIAVNPTTASFPIPKAVVESPTAFPLLHRTLVKPMVRGTEWRG